jgi:alkylhydroperoxidase family enzyme
VNSCHYCISAHSYIATNLAKVDADTLLKLRKGTPTGNAKYDVLAALTRAVGERKGFGVEAEVKAFLAAGYTQAALVEVMLIIGLNTANNFLNHVADTPIDFPLAAELPAVPQHAHA